VEVRSESNSCCSSFCHGQLNSSSENEEETMADEGEKETTAPKSGVWDASLLPFDPREVVAKNVSGSTAGAGSGDFHVYRNQRRKELFRIEKLEKQSADIEDDRKFEEELMKKKEVEEEKTRKRYLFWRDRKAL